MRKLFFALLAVILVFVTSACGEKEPPSSEEQTKNPSFCQVA